MNTPDQNPAPTAPSDLRTALASVEAAVEDIRAGKMVILVDDEDRENEGDLCMAAECVTPEAINFMAREGRGLICLPMTEERMRRLDLEMMVPDHENMRQLLSLAHRVALGDLDLGHRPL